MLVEKNHISRLYPMKRRVTDKHKDLTIKWLFEKEISVSARNRHCFRMNV